MAIRRNIKRNLATLIATGAVNPKRNGWTAHDIPTLGWWAARDETSITVGSGGVSSLADQKSGYPPLTQPTTVARPQTGTHTLNGLNMMYYAGGDALATYGDTFQVPSSGNLSVFHLAEVFLPLGNVAEGMFAMSCAGECTDWQFVGGVSVANFNGRIVANELGGTDTNFTPAMGIGPALYNVVFDFDSSTITAYLSGTARNETVAYTVKISDPQTFIIMSNRVGQTLAGHVGETLIIEDTSEATRQKVEGSILWEWGLQGQLPANHPYKNARP